MGHTLPDISCFGAEKEVEDELDAVSDCEDIVDPAVIDSLSDEAHQKRGHRNTQSDQERPDTHVLGSLVLEEGLLDDATSDSGGRADEEGDDGTTGGHGGVGVGIGASYVADTAADEGQKKYGASTVSFGDGLPDDRCASKNGDLQGS